VSDLIKDIILPILCFAAGSGLTFWLKYREWGKSRKEKQLLEIINCLVQFQELTVNLVKRIEELVEPMLENNDLLATCKLYNEFINDLTLNSGYDKSDGKMRTIYNNLIFDSKEIKDKTIRDKLKSLFYHIDDFKHISYALKKNSGKNVNTMEKVTILHNLLVKKISPGNDQQLELAQQIRRDFSKTIQNIRYISKKYKADISNSILKDIPTDISSQKDLIEIVRTFCIEWKQSVFAVGRGQKPLQYEIGEVETLLRIAKS